MLALLVLVATPSMSETNQASGSVVDNPAALIDSNVFTLNRTGSPLTLVKRAYLSDGTRVPTGSELPKGSIFHFLIYIGNDSTTEVHDINLQDVLDPAFEYRTDTIRIDNSIASCGAPVCSAAIEDAIFAAVDPKTPLNDSVDTDIASQLSGTIDLGDEIQANAQLNIAAQKIWAVAFTVRVP